MIKSMRYRTICSGHLPLGLATKIQLGRSTQHRFRHSGNEERDDRSRESPTPHTRNNNKRAKKIRTPALTLFRPSYAQRKGLPTGDSKIFFRLTARNVKHGQADH
jgi:hypothetical protein